MVGNKILYYAPSLEKVTKATVTRMTKKLRRRWPGWANIRTETNEELCINLDTLGENHVSWRYSFDVPQIDGNYTISSLESSISELFEDPPDPLNDSNLHREFHANPVNLRITFPNVSKPVIPTVKSNDKISPNVVYRLPDNNPLKEDFSTSARLPRISRDNQEDPDGFSMYHEPPASTVQVQEKPLKPPFFQRLNPVRK